MKILVLLGLIATSCISCNWGADSADVSLDSATVACTSQVIDTLYVDTVVFQFEDGFECYLVGLQRSMNSDQPIPIKYLKSQSDTLVYELQMEENLDDAQLCFNSKVVKDFSVDVVNERRTMVLSLQDEGPHYDLYDWHPHEEPYSAMQKIDATTYKPQLTDYENLPFGKVNYSELREYLKNQKGIDDSWVSLLDSVDVKKREASLVDYPLQVGVGYRWVQIQFGKGKVKVVKLILPQGC